MKGGINQEVGINIYTLLYIKLVMDRNLIYNTRNSILCNNLHGKRNWKTIYIYTHTHTHTHTYIHTYIGCVCMFSLSFQLCSPVDCSMPGSSVHGIFQASHTVVGFHFLFQGIFLTQGSNSCLLYWQVVLYHCATWETCSQGRQIY